MSTIIPKGSTWYLLQCKPREDQRAEVNLLQQNYVIFRPQLATERLVRGKLRKALDSLFPGYLFIQLCHDDNWAPLRSTRGVSRIVDFNHGPATVADHVIEDLRARCVKPYKPQAIQEFKPGETLQIIRGPLSTYEGIFLSMVGSERVNILLQFLNREQHVYIPLSDLQRRRS